MSYDLIIDAIFTYIVYEIEHKGDMNKFWEHNMKSFQHFEGAKLHKF